MSEPNFLPVTVDKSHLITIGERLYTESIELIRELVNNAYDADATEVRVTLSDDVVRVDDDGAGMDFDGLRQYFNIGSPEKLQKPKSPRFRRDRTVRDRKVRQSLGVRTVRGRDAEGFVCGQGDL